MLILGCRVGDRITFELPDGRAGGVVLVCLPNTGKSGSYTRIGLDFPADYKIQRPQRSEKGGGSAAGSD